MDSYNNISKVKSYRYISSLSHQDNPIQLRYIHKFGDAKSGHIVTPQYHTCHEIINYGSDCTGTTIIDGKKYTFNPGDIAVISKGTVHSENHSGNGSLIYFGFDSSDSIVLPPNKVYYDMWDAKLLFNTMLREAINQEQGYEQIITNEIQKLLILLMRKTHTTSIKSKNLEYVKNYIDENYAQNINLAALAKNIGYSSEHFRRLFLRDYNTSPKSYLISLRCEKAIELLRTTSLSCTEIAYRCGFSDSTQLSKLIKKNYSTSPLKIRKSADVDNL